MDINENITIFFIFAKTISVPNAKQSWRKFRCQKWLIPDLLKRRILISACPEAILR